MLMEDQILKAKCAVFHGTLPEALRKASQWIEDSGLPIFHIIVDSEDDGSYFVFVYFHDSNQE